MQVAFFPRTGTHCIGGLVGNSTTPDNTHSIKTQCPTEKMNLIPLHGIAQRERKSKKKPTIARRNSGATSNRPNQP